MIQTQIQLTEEQTSALEELARRRNMSVSELIYEGIDILLKSAPIPKTDERKQRALAVAGRFRSGLGDLSRRHDKYLADALNT